MAVTERSLASAAKLLGYLTVIGGALYAFLTFLAGSQENARILAIYGLLIGIWAAAFVSLWRRVRSAKILRAVSLVIIIGIPSAVAAKLYLKRLQLKENRAHFTVAVANFEDPKAPELKKYEVTNFIIGGLQKLVAANPDMRIIQLGSFVNGNDRETARDQAEALGAKIVIWGDFDHTPTDVAISLRVDILGIPFVSVESSGLPETNDIAELEHYALQQRLSQRASNFALMILGVYRTRQAQFESAAAVFDQVLRAPDSGGLQAVAYLLRGTILNELGRFGDAVESFDRSIERDPNLARSYNNRGYALRHMGLVTEAIADYSTAIRLDPRYALAFLNRGYANKQLEKYDAATADYDSALRLAPQSFNILHNRAVLYEATARYDNAIADLSKILDLAPRFKLYPSLYAERGQTYRKKAEFDLAIKDFTTAIFLDPRNSDYFTARAVLYHETGHKSEARRDLDRAIALQPKLALAYAYRASLLFETGDPNNAILDMNRFVALMDSTKVSHTYWRTELQRQLAASR